MKKIKYLLGLGILSALFSTCFGATGYNSTFSYLSSDGQTYTVFNVGSERKSSISYIGYDWFSTSGTAYGSALYDVQLPTGFPYNGLGFTRDFYSPFGLNFYYSSGDTYLYYIRNGSTNNDFYTSLELAYLTWDGFPLIYDSVGNYLTFARDNIIIYNGISKQIDNVNQLKYCFYGNGFSLSCLFSTDSTSNGYTFKSFGVVNDSIVQYDNIAIIPLHESSTDTGNAVFTGGISLVLSYGYYLNAQNEGLIWNLLNCYSSDYSHLQDCRINSKGYINLSSSVFFNRSFVSTISSNSNISSDILGSFAEIFYKGGHFYFRNNSSLFHYYNNNTSATNRPRNCYNYNNCYVQGELPLQDDNTVVDILLVSSGGNFSYTGTLSMNFDCYNAEFCEYYTGGNGNLTKACHTQCVSSGVLEEGSYIGYDGTVYFLSGTSFDFNNFLLSHNSSSMFDGSFIDSGGILSPDYFSGFFTAGSYKIGVCPFNYYNGPLDFLSDVKIGDLYIFKPILCFYSAFQDGKSVKYFEDYQIFPPEISSQLIHGDSDNHKLLFAFFDVLFAFGILGLLRFLSRHLF